MLELDSIVTSGNTSQIRLIELKKALFLAACALPVTCKVLLPTVRLIAEPQARFRPSRSCSYFVLVCHTDLAVKVCCGLLTRGVS